MIVYKVEDFDNWHVIDGNREMLPIMSKKGYFLTMNLQKEFPKMDWESLQTMEITEDDLITERL